MAEIKDQNTKRIKLFGATILSQELISRKDATTIKDEEEEEEREFKRPEKLIPCPRCKSMETKFCYFNNYNVNQPRHYCKGCQRYWTAGGALRNVPVGAGRRKAKPPGLFSDCCYLFETSTETNEDGFDRRDGVVDEEWRVAEHGGFRHVFQTKRRRNASNSQLC